MARKPKTVPGTTPLTMAELKAENAGLKAEIRSLRDDINELRSAPIPVTNETLERDNGFLKEKIAEVVKNKAAQDLAFKKLKAKFQENYDRLKLLEDIV